MQSKLHINENKYHICIPNALLKVLCVADVFNIGYLLLSDKWYISTIIILCVISHSQLHIPEKHCLGTFVEGRCMSFKLLHNSWGLDLLMSL